MKTLEQHLEADVVAIISPLKFGVERRVGAALDRDPRRDQLAVVLDTLGGTVDTVEKIVYRIRQYYQNVTFIVPNSAMSAGTLLALSGNEVMMDDHSYLGPIDLQVERGNEEDRRMVPGVAYLQFFDDLVRKGSGLSEAESILLQNFDLAELDQIRLESDLSKNLLQEWLVRYKFSDWTITDGQGVPVTPELKASRAKEIANLLSDHTKWMTHDRSIGIDTLREKLGLRITNLAEHPDEELRPAVMSYYNFLIDYMSAEDLVSFVHGMNYF